MTQADRSQGHIQNALRTDSRQNLRLRPAATERLEETRRAPRDIAASHDSFGQEPTAQDPEAKRDRWVYIKLTSFCSSKDPIGRVKREPTDRRQCSDVMSDKGSESTVYKEPLQSNDKITND